MEFTDEQYIQVLRYIDGEMDESELEAFRIALEQNKELSAEVAFYIELKSVFTSADKKISSAGIMEMDKANSDQQGALKMIKKARLEWERKHEKGSEEKQGINEVGSPAIQLSSRYTSKGISRCLWLLYSWGLLV